MTMMSKMTNMTNVTYMSNSDDGSISVQSLGVADTTDSDLSNSDGGNETGIGNGDDERKGEL